MPQWQYVGDAESVLDQKGMRTEFGEIGTSLDGTDLGDVPTDLYDSGSAAIEQRAKMTIPLAEPSCGV